MNVSYIVHISGKVQGVYFRASCQQQAIELGLSGYVSNLADGDVEVLLCGEQTNIDKMLVWLAQGPEEAEVTNLTHKQIALQSYSFFSIN
ncbi:acylphosphatase [Colwellia sp. E2M01]|uniref:acylphosphatase n=1 Tax=Colwellia sp. E2M01 TaxID=2841561 RepID=UPI001C09CA48|nr:acylphosphatase [Colwellia sp. E2M01]MBU2871502.1 acylphosphatase [Colwellia sp. E2M01]